MNEETARIHWAKWASQEFQRDPVMVSAATEAAIEAILQGFTAQEVITEARRAALQAKRSKVHTSGQHHSSVGESKYTNLQYNEEQRSDQEMSNRPPDAMFYDEEDSSLDYDPKERTNLHRSLKGRPSSRSKFEVQSSGIRAAITSNPYTRWTMYGLVTLAAVGTFPFSLAAIGIVFLIKTWRSRHDHTM